MKILFIAIVLALTVLYAGGTHTTYAKSSVINTIEIENNTGGNVVKGGRVIEGTEESSVSITTVIDGEVVVDIHETSSGEPLVIERTVKASTTDAVSTTIVELYTGESEVSTDASTIRRTLADEYVATSEVNTSDVEDFEIERSEGRTRLFAGIFEAFTRTLAYVLSNIFTFERTS